MWEGGGVLLFTTECLFLTWLDKYSREVRMEFHEKFRVGGVRNMVISGGQEERMY